MRDMKMTSRIDLLRHNQPELSSEIKEYALTAAANEFSFETVSRITPSVLLVMNSGLLEDITHMGKNGKGPVALQVVVAEWIYEHPEIAEQIMNDDRWKVTI